ncbi:MAG: hypothetical protein IK076_08655 [Bacteroidales bacterium]|nr:hypothetical protein [Bacteroidales bacterium]
MISHRPDIDPEGLYNQAEASRLLGVDRHTLARWEKDPRNPLEGFTRRRTHEKVYKGKALLRAWGAIA